MCSTCGHTRSVLRHASAMPLCSSACAVANAPSSVQQLKSTHPATPGALREHQPSWGPSKPENKQTRKQKRAIKQASENCTTKTNKKGSPKATKKGTPKASKKGIPKAIPKAAWKRRKRQPENDAKSNPESNGKRQPSAQQRGFGRVTPYLVTGFRASKQDPVCNNFWINHGHPDVLLTASLPHASLLKASLLLEGMSMERSSCWNGALPLQPQPKMASRPPWGRL